LEDQHSTADLATLPLQVSAHGTLAQHHQAGAEQTKAEKEAIMAPMEQLPHVCVLCGYISVLTGANYKEGPSHSGLQVPVNKNTADQSEPLQMTSPQF